MTDNERRAQLYLQHPDECPDIIGTLDYLIHPPSKLAATQRWLEFRDRTVVPMIAARPDDPNLPRFLAQIALVLAWRATIAPEDRFWKKDWRPNSRGITQRAATITPVSMSAFPGP